MGPRGGPWKDPEAAVLRRGFRGESSEGEGLRRGRVLEGEGLGAGPEESEGPRGRSRGEAGPQDGS